jgi:hypothetical protein
MISMRINPRSLSHLVSMDTLLLRRARKSLMRTMVDKMRGEVGGGILSSLGDYDSMTA